MSLFVPLCPCPVLNACGPPGPDHGRFRQSQSIKTNTTPRFAGETRDGRTLLWRDANEKNTRNENSNRLAFSQFVCFCLSLSLSFWFSGALRFVAVLNFYSLVRSILARGPLGFKKDPAMTYCKEDPETKRRRINTWPLFSLALALALHVSAGPCMTDDTPGSLRLPRGVTERETANEGHANMYILTKTPGLCSSDATSLAS